MHPSAKIYFCSSSFLTIGLLGWVWEQRNRGEGDEGAEGYKNLWFSVSLAGGFKGNPGMAVVGWVNDFPNSRLQLLAVLQPLQRNLQEILRKVIKDCMPSM